MNATAIRAFFASRSEAEDAQRRLEAGESGVETSLLPAREATPAGEDESRGVIAAVGDFLLRKREVARTEAPADADWIVTARRLSPEHRDTVARALEEAGALHIEGLEAEEGEGGHGWTRFFHHLGELRAPPQAAPPRPVQPGFADASPGIVPDPAPSPRQTSGEPRDPDETADVKGRFADQLDRLPEEPGAEGASENANGQGDAARSAKDVQAEPKGANVEAVPPGTPGAGENICRACEGSGRVGDSSCPDCGGSGKVTTPIGGG